MHVLYKASLSSPLPHTTISHQLYNLPISPPYIHTYIHTYHMEQAKTQIPCPHVAIFPGPGMGHLIPFIELAKRLVDRHGFQVTCIVPTVGPPSKAMTTVLEALPAGINHVYLPSDTFEGEPDSIEQISGAISRSLPHLRHVLDSLIEKVPLVALLVDMFSTEAIQFVKDLKIPSYIFFTSSATSLSVCFHVQKLGEMVSCEFRDLPDPVRAPGCIPIHGRDLFDPVQDKKSASYRWFLEFVERFRFADGIMVNSFMEMEEGAIKALQGEVSDIPPVYPIGPLINDGSSSIRVEGSECLQWLNDQPSGSVLFVSFGSLGTLSQAQINELALGLEMSDQKFLWVVRSPNDASANAVMLGDKSNKDPLDFLPKGFLERTKGRGLVVPSWAPQAQVLSHSSTGGFLTHCGWNSTLESVVNGMSLIAWPLYAEQKMNAVVLSEELDVALRPKINQNGIVERHEIANIVKALMEGEEGKMIRKRMKVFKDAAAKAPSDEGNSAKALSELALKWRNLSE